MATIKDLRSITPRTNGTRKESAIKKIARHHSATTSGSWSAFWAHWNKTLGWGTGGYHEIILRDGTVELCYDPHEITNGVGGQNSYIYNICVVGNGSFTVAQEKAFDERCKIAMARFNLKASDVLGHNEFPKQATSCPGINMTAVRKRLSSGNVVEQASKPVVKPTPSKSTVSKPAAKPKVVAKPKANLTVDGYWGVKLTKAWQTYFGLVSDGEIWGQVKNSVTSKITGGVKYGKGGSPLIREIQRLVGAVVDGILGKETIRKLQAYLGTPVDGELWSPSTMVKELQRRLNKGKL